MKRKQNNNNNNNRRNTLNLAHNTVQKRKQKQS